VEIKLKLTEYIDIFIRMMIIITMIIITIIIIIIQIDEDILKKESRNGFEMRRQILILLFQKLDD